ncbi:MAG: glycoside hydrolase family 3 C-terminal domain-containing protein [Ardenticatenaceae bacterium]|nr:glycoside hydrolase family 3 C-terminal domain-containing protein [Ardenticatenaceae bacterium]MCB9445038.1 glycoside hydrolase family 3 C-terminal domain-containing protein [Ardenticatenaceae bacterium]
MSVKELLGYKLMLAFEGTTPPPRILDWLAERPVGGFTLFRPLNVASPGQVRELTERLQTAVSPQFQSPLLIAADQEGGQLMALGAELTQFPGNMALAAARDPELTRRVGQAIGTEMAALGVNLNYAPNCDINTNPGNPAAGIRTFGDDPALAAQMAGAMVDGLQSAGVAATMKHFPGKGGAQVDSHFAMPLIDHSRERLEQMELRPFRAAIESGVKLAMTGHFAIPSLTEHPDLPATLSRAVMHDLVRQELGFDGVTITDALDMGALTQGAGQIIDIIAATRAEVDLLLTTNQPEVQERLYHGLQLAYSRGLVEKWHIENSVNRIFALKQWVSQQTWPDISVIGCAEHRELEAEAARRSITLVRNDAGLLPLRLASDAKIAVIMPQPQDLTPADTSSYVKPGLATAVRQHHAHVDEFITTHPPTESEITALRRKAVGYDLLIIGTISASMQPEQTALVNELLALNVPTVTIALRTPYDLTVYPEAKTHLCTYSIHEPSMAAVTAVLWGKTPATGKLPVTIPGLYAFGHGLNLNPESN